MEKLPFKHIDMIVGYDELIAELKRQPFCYRKENIPDQMLIEWAMLAWVEVENPRLMMLGEEPSPSEAIGGYIHEMIIDTGVLVHLDQIDRANVIKDVYTACMTAYHFLSTLMETLGVTYLERHSFEIVDFFGENALRIRLLVNH